MKDFALFTHTPINSENKCGEGTVFHIHNTPDLLPFPFLLVCLSIALFIWCGLFGFVTRTSKNADCPFLQNPRTRVSNRASSLSFAFRFSKLSPFNGCKPGSISTSLQTIFRRLASNFFKLSCLMYEVMSKLLPLTHFVGNPFIFV